MAEDNLTIEYAEISDALVSWFISQEISLPRACGVMVFLTGVCIGEHASNETVMDEGIRKHLAVMRSLAKLAYDKREVK